MGNPKRTGKYSYADYLTWPEGERWELIDGVAYDMSPAPNTGFKDQSEKLLLYERTGRRSTKPAPFVREKNHPKTKANQPLV